MPGNTIIYGITTEEFVVAVSAIMLLLWRTSYGYRKGLIAEALGLISVVAAFAVAYYAIRAFNNLKTFQLGEVPGKIIGLVIAFIVYRVFHAIADAFRHVSEVPFIGTIDSILGSIVGFAEACILIYVFTYITGIDVKEVALTVLDKLITNI